MSIEAVAWVLKHSRSSGNDRCVLIAIANHADAHGEEAWPGIDLIASEANVSRRTVFNCLDRLESSGEIERSGQRDNRHGKPTTIWRMPIYSATLAPINKVQVQTPKRASSGAIKCKTEQRIKGIEPSLTVLNRPVGKQRGSDGEHSKFLEGQGASQIVASFDGEALPPELEHIRPALLDWIAYRKKSKLKAYCADTWRSKFKTLAAMSDPEAAIRHSIDQGYQGIFEPARNGRPQKETLAEADRRLADAGF